MLTKLILIFLYFGHFIKRNPRIKIQVKITFVFRLFLPLCWTASRPYRLSYINALRINQSYYSKDQSMKFWRKLLNSWRWKETDWCHGMLNTFLFINENLPNFIKSRRISIMKQTIWPRNHTSYKENYFYKFVANALRDNIGQTP